MFQFQVMETAGYKVVVKACKDSMVHKKMVCIYAAPGLGKSFVLDHFRSKNDNVFHVELGKSIGARGMYQRILRAIMEDDADYAMSTMSLIQAIQAQLDMLPGSSLIIIDEGGKIRPSRVEYLHELRNLTDSTSGIIISAPVKFKHEIAKWLKNNVLGVDEFYSRVSYSTELPFPTSKEITGAFKLHGIDKLEGGKELLKQILSFPREETTWRLIRIRIDNLITLDS